MNKKIKKLPLFFKPLLWSYDFSKVDLEKYKRSIIVNTINYGDLKHWKWIIEYYGANILQKELSKMAKSEIRPRAMKLAELFLSIKPSKYAHRSIKR